MHPTIWIFHISLLVFLPISASSAIYSQLSRPDAIPRNEIALRRCISSFWTAWQQKDFQRASQYILPAQREQFKRTRKFPVRKWEIVAVKILGTRQKAEVKVRIERYEPIMGYFQWEQTAIWIRHAALWQMQIPDARLNSP
jgi:hypothetical protein